MQWNELVAVQVLNVVSLIYFKEDCKKLHTIILNSFFKVYIFKLIHTRFGKIFS